MIYLGADHRGYELKEKAKQWLAELGYQYEDCGAFAYNKDDDYPDFATAVAQKVSAEAGNRGILFCGSGIGVAVAANKIKGIRAGTAAGPKQIKSAINDEDLNIVAISTDHTDENTVKEIIKTFLETKFSEEERHVRRINKIKQLEQ